MPLSPALSPLVPRGEREKICALAVANATAVGRRTRFGYLVAFSAFYGWIGVTTR